MQMGTRAYREREKQEHLARDNIVVEDEVRVEKTFAVDGASEK
jgi:hypothetical protein